MSNQVFSEWLKISKNAVEPLVRLNEITFHAVESVARQQLDVARDYLELGSKQAALYSSAEKPEDLFTAQSQLVSEFGEQLINRAQEFAKIASETQSAISEWVEEAAGKAVKSAA